MRSPIVHYMLLPLQGTHANASRLARTHSYIDNGKVV